MPKTPRSPGRRSPLWARLCLSFGILLSVLSGGALVGTKLLVSTATAAVPQTNLLGSARTTVQRQHAAVTGAKNILLVGLDTRPSWTDTDQLSRSDSIILVHIPANRSAAYMISLPRDAYVDIPAYDNGKTKYYGGKDKINAAFAFGSRGLTGTAAEQHGFELLTKTVQKLTGITPDAGAIIDYGGFKQVIQVLGHVCMYVDEDVRSIHIGHTRDGKTAIPYHTNSAGLNPRPIPGVTANFYKKGNHCFDPTEALDYARQRDLLSLRDSDYGRQRHQQQLIKAIMKQAVHAGLNSPTKLPGLLSAIGKAVTVDNGGVSLEDWVFAMRTINPDDMVTIKTNDGKFNPETVRGQSVEILSGTSLALLRSARDDTMAAFVAANPTWVAKS